jgi:2-(acetamidomethylene)succinate hydrolase
MAEALGDQFHIYAPDQRGHGRTDKADGDYSAQEYAEDLGLFMQELGLDRAVVVGHSLGGVLLRYSRRDIPSACRPSD